jgi:hypothetical protein
MPLLLQLLCAVSLPKQQQQQQQQQQQPHCALLRTALCTAASVKGTCGLRIFIDASRIDIYAHAARWALQVHETTPSPEP